MEFSIATHYWLIQTLTERLHVSKRASGLCSCGLGAYLCSHSNQLMYDFTLVPRVSRQGMFWPDGVDSDKIALPASLHSFSSLQSRALPWHPGSWTTLLHESQVTKSHFPSLSSPNTVQFTNSFLLTSVHHNRNARASTDISQSATFQGLQILLVNSLVYHTPLCEGTLPLIV